MKTIKILGAGLSGLTAAINLKKAGFKVEVFEKNKDVGQRFNGDLQGLENWSSKKDVLRELKTMNLKINFNCQPSKQLNISNGSKTEKIILKNPLFYAVQRGGFKGSLDYGFKKQANKLGVKLYFNKTITLNKADIVATGPILKQILAVAKGIVFNTTMKNTAWAMVNDQAAFKGYSYLLVVDGRGCLATVLFDKFNLLNNCFAHTKILFSKILKLDVQQPKNFSGIGSFSNHNIFRKNKALFIGEAAGLQDLLWGFGMRKAIQSGYLVAQSIIKNKDYEKEAKKYFANQAKASLVNRFLWEKLSFNNYDSLIKQIIKIKGSFSPWLYSFYNYNLLQKLIYPFAYTFFCLSPKMRENKRLTLG